MSHLPAQDLPELVADLRAALDAVERTGSVAVLVSELAAWETTGRVHADPASVLDPGLVDLLEHFTPPTRPR